MAHPVINSNTNFRIYFTFYFSFHYINTAVYKIGKLIAL